MSVAVGEAVGEGGAEVDVNEGVRVAVGVEVGGIGVAVGAGGASVADGEGVAVEETGPVVAVGACTPAALQAVIKNAARVTTTPAAGLILASKLVVIKGGMIALNGRNVQYRRQVAGSK